MPAASPVVQAVHCPECQAVVIEATKLTRKQFQVVQAAANPANGTVTAIAKDAGTDRSYTSELLQKPAISTAIATRKRQRLDRARDLLPKAASIVAGELNTTKDAEYALRVWPIAAAIVEKGLDGEESESPEEHIERLQRLVREIVLSSLTCGLDRPGKAVEILERHGRRCVREVEACDS